MFKGANVVMLPTNEKASIFLDTIESGVLIFARNYMSNTIHWKDVQHRHLYITSDDEIKEGDWCLNISKGITYKKDKLPMDIMWKKIIATTDSSLTIKSEQAGDNAWYNPLPKPSDSFITKCVEEYNKGNVITDVMVEYEEDGITCEVKRQGEDCNGCQGMCDWEYNYKLKTNSKDNTITIKKVKDSWNREEVIGLLKKVKQDFPYHRGVQVLDGMLDNWIKENL